MADVSTILLYGETPRVLGVVALRSQAFRGVIQHVGVWSRCPGWCLLVWEVSYTVKRGKLRRETSDSARHKPVLIVHTLHQHRLALVSIHQAFRRSTVTCKRSIGMV